MTIPCLRRGHFIRCQAAKTPQRGTWGMEPMRCPKGGQLRKRYWGALIVLGIITECVSRSCVELEILRKP